MDAAAEQSLQQRPFSEKEGPFPDDLKNTELLSKHVLYPDDMPVHDHRCPLFGALFVFKAPEFKLCGPVTGNEMTRLRFNISWNFTAALFAAITAAFMEITA